MLIGVQPQYHPVCLTEAVDGPNQCKINCRRIKSVPKSVLQPCISYFAVVPGSGKRTSLHARQGICSGEGGENQFWGQKGGWEPAKRFFEAAPAPGSSRTPTSQSHTHTSGCVPGACA